MFPTRPRQVSALQDLAWLVGEWIDESPDADDRGHRNLDEEQDLPELCLQGRRRPEWTTSKAPRSSAGTRRRARSAPGCSIPTAGSAKAPGRRRTIRWIVKFSQVLPDGRKASATNIYTLIDANTFTWKSIGRKVDEEFLPNVEEVKMVRKTASDAVKEASKAAEETAKARDKEATVRLPKLCQHDSKTHSSSDR